MSDDLIVEFPGEVVYGSTERSSPEDLLTKAKERATDPEIFNEFPPFFWPARISTETLDAHFTRMRPSTLRNYADDAASGVPFQDSHKTDSLARVFGRSVTGKYTQGSKTGVARTDAEFYTLRNLDPEIDRFVNKMRAGLVDRVSVGFSGGQYICSICGKDMLRDLECWHYPGFYFSKGEDGKGERVLCTADIEEARLREVSGVYMGSNPDAMIMKATRMIEAGKLDVEKARILEARYRIKLPGSAHAFPGTGEGTMTGKDSHAETETGKETQVAAGTSDDLLRKVRQALGAADTDDLIEVATRHRDDLTRLRPLAKDGEQYRNDLIAEALAEGVRASGEKFDTDTYKALLAQAPLATIKRMRDDWAEIAQKTFPGGRQTRDDDETAGGTEPAHDVSLPGFVYQAP